MTLTTARPGTISHGTLLPTDLIPAFHDVLAVHNPDHAAILRDEYHDVFDAILDGTYTLDDVELADNADWLLNDLYGALNDVAPDGYYFGAIEGDGSDFGFWPHTDLP
jgi:hypothetical protein